MDSLNTDCDITVRLNELALKENELEVIIESVEGTIEKKLARLNEMDINKEYFIIFDKYAALCKESLEALKRGVFLMWYWRLEPSFITGIFQINTVSDKKIIDLLTRRLKSDVLDYELDWMLSYYSNWSFLFHEYPAFIDLLEHKKQESMPSAIDKAAMNSRGTMGNYFLSLERYS